MCVGNFQNFEGRERERERDLLLNIEHRTFLYIYISDSVQQLYFHFV